MNEQEHKEEVGILDKACRQCAVEFLNGGVNELRNHAINVAALLRKLERLEAAPPSAGSAPA